MAAGNVIDSILEWPRWFKRLFVVTVDAFICVLTLWMAFSLRLDSWDPLEGIELITIPVSLVIAIPLFITHGLYRAIFRYIGWAAFMAIIRAVAIYGLIFMTIFTFISVPGIPRTVGILQPMLLLLVVGMSRLVAKQLFGNSYRLILQRSEASNALIYGAGSIGRQLSSAIRNAGELRVAGYLDDDPKLHGALIDGVYVYDPATLKETVRKLNARTVLLAVPNIEPQRRKAIIESLRGARVAVRIMPNVNDLVQGRVRMTDLEELDINDLLGRPAVPPEEELLARNIQGKVVMVTGAGGSIGSELCRQICKIGPERLLLVEHNEYSLYSIVSELERNPDCNSRLVPLLASVRDQKRVEEIVGSFKPHTIYHAAAYKHVPLVEQNPVEGVSNNVFGTLTVAQVAAENDVEAFVLVSTDKAVRPTNIMGASKRIAELILQAFSDRGCKTVFSMVRFGNVLGSSGSVVPLFRQQIASGGPITLTHPEITRYFMSIPEAAQLVIQAGAMGQGGDVFVLDMGEPVKIIDLARGMVELSGLTVKDDSNPDGDIEFVMTGLRPAEKLYEELLIGENPSPTRHPRIMTAQEEYFEWTVLEEKLEKLRNLMGKGAIKELRTHIGDLVSGYDAASDIVDLMTLHQLEMSHHGAPPRHLPDEMLAQDLQTKR
ncbi:nucleoside-diphosphate sugar epimerase/dehydratase [Rhizobium sp. L1K21]|uniref:polysaccharide biosynthesis protein n=1 Tax=Rhizobium sp. L1K21 TaxID=2954933 RepID=UPI002093D962|nr:nucleoside-diphosphate sugar epimerase/dehydratase [Rhizobium sp. L1K21]MCO6186621.1 polysaccharide biosynthesis protein [Rhizobium sp. L1K21]